jgi:hypothetical protein
MAFTPRKVGTRRLSNSGNLAALFAEVGADINHPTLGGTVVPRAEEMIHARSLPEHLELLLPNAEQTALNAVIDYIEAQIRTGYAYFAGSFRVMQKKLSELPNCEISLYPTADTDTGIAKNTVVGLFPATSGAGSALPFFFTDEMWFGSLVTGAVDASVGWRFAANSVKFSTDIVSGIPFDLSFLGFQSDVVFSRTALGVYAQRGFLGASPINFNISAVHNRTANQIMIDGVALRYRDERCYNSKGYKNSLEYMARGPGGEGYDEIVQELIGHRAEMVMRGGRPTSFPSVRRGGRTVWEALDGERV